MPLSFGVFATHQCMNTTEVNSNDFRKATNQLVKADTCGWNRILLTVSVSMAWNQKLKMGRDLISVCPRTLYTGLDCSSSRSEIVWPTVFTTSVELCCTHDVISKKDHTLIFLWLLLLKPILAKPVTKAAFSKS